jgi:hypothetical protein
VEESTDILEKNIRIMRMYRSYVPWLSRPNPSSASSSIEEVATDAKELSKKLLLSSSALGKRGQGQKRLPKKKRAGENLLLYSSAMIKNSQLYSSPKIR